MNQFFFVATRDPANSFDSSKFYAQAADLARSGAGVSIYLVQNGVLGARRIPDASIEHAHQQGVRIFADDFSMRERGITADEVQSFVEPIGMDAWIESVLAADAPRVVWH